MTATCSTPNLADGNKRRPCRKGSPNGESSTFDRDSPCLGQFDRTSPSRHHHPCPLGHRKPLCNASSYFSDVHLKLRSPCGPPWLNARSTWQHSGKLLNVHHLRPGSVGLPPSCNRTPRSRPCAARTHLNHAPSQSVVHPHKTR